MSNFIFVCTLTVTLLVVLGFCYKAPIELKLLYIILSITVFLYSGLGISYNTVDNQYVIQYFVFLIVLLGSIKSVYQSRIRFTIGNTRSGCFAEGESLSSSIDSVLENSDKIVTIFTIIFFASMFFYMVYPTNRLGSLFNISNFTSYSIHARRAEFNSNTLLKISDTIGTALQPFFFVYLYNCAIGFKKKKIWGFLLSVLWFFLAFGKYNYLSRYQLIIFLGFFVLYIVVAKYEQIIIDKKTIALCILLAIIVIPFLVSFVDLRLGRSSSTVGFWESVSSLIEEECGYPQYYDICIKNAGIVDPIQYILWLIFLPIPSALWSGKPVVQVAYSFTSLFTSMAVTDDGYSNLLPSILGESFLIFGKYFFWIEAIILGVVIGLYFRFFLKSRKMSLLTAYMLLMLATIGRGGSQSYLGVVINGSIMLVIFVFVFNKTAKTRR